MTRLPGGLVDIDYPRFLSRHDVVYLAPASRGIDGLPVGNGDLGAMIWTPADRLQLQINTCDLWDDQSDGPFSSWGDDDEERSTMLRSAGLLTISHGLPTYDQIYLTNFEARLCLATAQVKIQSETPFARASSRIFASEAAGVLVVQYADHTEEEVPRRVELSRWGSRSLLHWYRKVRREVPRSLRETQSGMDGQYAWIQQELRDLRFAVVALCPDTPPARCFHRRAAGFETKPIADFAGTLYLAVATSEETEDPLATAIARAGRAAAQGAGALFEEHRRSWQGFWEKSFVNLPPDQDYLENLWYLNSYHLGSTCKGRFPPNHINAIWSWNRDVRPWAHYYHWNEQLHVWPMHAIGHGELAFPYFRWRRAMLDHAVDDGWRVHGRAGAFYSDVANRRGYQATEAGLSHNLTPGPQIAADFWRHFEYTRDQAFLERDAYPVIREVTRFYLETVQPTDDGHYTFVETQPYESNVYLSDTLTDLAHARQVFQIFLEACQLVDQDADLRERCREVLAHLVDYVVVRVATEYQISPRSVMDLKPVLFKELKPGDPTMPIWSLGYKVGARSPSAVEEIADGAPVHEGMGNPAKGLWIFTSTNLAPVVPANQVGLDNRGTAEFDVAVNTVRALGNDSHAFSLGMLAKARLGLAEELKASLEAWPRSFQIYPQGFYHYFLANHPDMQGAESVREISIVDSPGEKIRWPMAMSQHMSLEGGPLLQHAINEMVLQSYSGTLRVFPSVTPEWAGQFRLHAVGRFVVSAARIPEETLYVIVESGGGETCRLANPWPGRAIARYVQNSGWTFAEQLSGEVVNFSMIAGDVSLLVPTGREPATLQPTVLAGDPNRAPKRRGNAQLGLARGY